MFTLAVFLIALVLIVFSLVMKRVETLKGRKIFLARLFAQSDVVIFKIAYWIKIAWQSLTFKNTKLIFSQITASIKHSVTAFKRRFDHKHSPFFAKKEHDHLKHKGSVSFFLKDISEHKKSLRDKDNS